MNVDDFPSGDIVDKARNLVDQFNETVDEILIRVRPVAAPQGGMYTAGNGLDLKVEPEHYWFIYTDRDGKEIYERDKVRITPGRSSELPNILNLQERTP